MTSDEYVVLQTFGPEYRVGAIFAVEDLFDSIDPDTKAWTINVKLAYEAFKDSEVFEEIEDAWDFAHGLTNGESEGAVILVSEFATIKFLDIAEAYGKLS